MTTCGFQRGIFVVNGKARIGNKMLNTSCSHPLCLTRTKYTSTWGGHASHVHYHIKIKCYQIDWVRHETVHWKGLKIRTFECESVCAEFPVWYPLEEQRNMPSQLSCMMSFQSFFCSCRDHSTSCVLWEKFKRCASVLILRCLWPTPTRHSPLLTFCSRTRPNWSTSWATSRRTARTMSSSTTRKPTLLNRSGILRNQRPREAPPPSSSIVYH